jgi:hypothetical protein
MAGLVLLFVAALIVSVLGGLLACWLARGWDFGLRLVVSSLVSTVIFAPVPAGIGHGGAVLPLGLALLPPRAHLEGVFTVASLLITWPITALVFVIVGRVSQPKRTVTSDSRPRARHDRR